MKLSVCMSTLSLGACVASSSLPSLQDRALAADLPKSIDEAQFASTEELRRDVDAICSGGLRMPGGDLHKSKVAWLQGQLKKIPGITITEQSYKLLAWEPFEGETLQSAGSLSVDSKPVAIGSAVAYSAPTPPKGVTAPLVFVPLGTNITAANSKGKIVVRNIDYPTAFPYSIIKTLAYNSTNDFNTSASYKRPSVAPTLLLDMNNADSAGALGVITIMDVPRKYIKNYFTPHDGTHYKVPGVFVGVDEGVTIKAAAQAKKKATISISARVYETTTKNVIATLPGQSPEQVVYASHTDGITYVQENGASSLLALARYFAKQPLNKRTRTLQFAFNTGHLHLSCEGSDMLSKQFDRTLKTNNVTLVIPIEHMGTREVETFSRGKGLPGNDLRYTGEGEPLIWCVGPMPPVLAAAREAFLRRKLDKSFLLPGAGLSQSKVVPEYTSFGGLGTYFHTRLVPTTSMITGPWSLWAPSFGSDAVDYERLRSQTLALGDLYYGVQGSTKAQILGKYAEYRQRRASGTPQYQLFIPREWEPSD